MSKVVELSNAIIDEICKIEVTGQEAFFAFDVVKRAIDDMLMTEAVSKYLNEDIVAEAESILNGGAGR